MAFDFLGTINGLNKFEELEEFVNVESKKLKGKVDTLAKERIILVELLRRFKAADQELRKEYSLSERSDIDYIKNPRPSYPRMPNVMDGVNASDVNFLKRMVLDQIKFKMENNEYKVKKIRDKIEQIDNEIAYINDSLTKFAEVISKIRTRFSLPDFVEAQKVPILDPKDIDDNIPVTPRDSGREVIDGVTYYLAIAVKSSKRSGEGGVIIFDTAAPTVEPNKVITLVNGKNNGPKTVARKLNERSIMVYEDLIDESPGTTKVKL